MTDELDRTALEIRLARCRELAEQFRTGQTAEMIRDLEIELRDQLRTLEAKQVAEQYAADQRTVVEAFRRQLN